MDRFRTWGFQPRGDVYSIPAGGWLPRGHYCGRTVWIGAWTGVWFTLCAFSSTRAQGKPTVESSPVVTDSHQTRATPGDRNDTASPRVTITVQDSTIEYVINEIARQARLKVVYGKASAVLATRVTVRVDRASPADAMRQVLRGTSLVASFASDGETVIVRTARDTIPGSPDRPVTVTGVIQGTVTDSATGTPATGATVTIRSLKRSVITAKDGRFIFRNVPLGSYQVTAQLFGYKSGTSAANVEDNRPVSLRFVLPAIATTLSGIVTTVTGEQRKLEIGNSIASINVDSVMKVAPVTTLTDLLENRVPGLVVQRGSGQPGDPSRIRLRGASSINNSNDPLLIVDGVRVDATAKAIGAPSLVTGSGVSNSGGLLAASAFDQIDPNSIESIDVFKGPSAAAMYGSDAANGVIVVTTKRGRPGANVWSGSLSQGVSYIPGQFPEGVYRFGSVLGYFSGRCSLVGTSGQDLNRCDVDSIVRYQALNDPYRSILSTGSTSSQSVTTSGGSQTLLYMFTVSTGGEYGVIKLSPYLRSQYLEKTGLELSSWMVRPDQYRTWDGTGKLTARISPRLQVEWTSTMFNSRQRKSSLGTEAIQDLMSTYRSDSLLPNDYIRYFERASRESERQMNAARTSWQATSWLPVTLVAGIDALKTSDETYNPLGRYDIQPDLIGHYGLARSSTQTRSLLVNSNVPFWNGRFTSLFGFNLQHEARELIATQMNGLPAGVKIPSSGFTQTLQETSASSTMGWFIEPRLNVASRFFVIPGFRIDNTGLQGSNAGVFGLPKMNMSWIASDENFFPWKSHIELMRFRVAFGTAGVVPGPGDRLRLWQIDTFSVLNPVWQGGTSVAALGNTHLRPERSTEFEGGFDAELFRGRLGFEYTEYRKTRYDAIVDVAGALSLSLGNLGSPYKANLGVIRNTGRDVVFRVTALESSRVGLHSQVSWTQNQNVVVRVNHGDGPLELDRVITSGISSAHARVVAGYPLWGVWGKPILGFHDADQNGLISLNEVVLGDSSVYLGQPEQKGSWTFSNDLTLFGGRIGLHASVSYQYGLTQIAASMKNVNSPFNSGANNPDAAPWYQAVAVSVRETPYGVTQTVNTWRFQTLSANVNLGRRIAGIFRARTMSAALQGRNLGLKSNYIGKDPNVNAALLSNGMTVDTGLLSQPRTWSVRLMLGN